MTGQGDGARLFFAAELALSTVRDVSETAAELHEPLSEAGLGVRWVPPANYHITLKYLGWAHREILPALRDAAAAALADCAGFEVEAASVGAFPRPERARVLWAGIKDADGRLADMARRLDAATHELGFPRESRGFHPHITLGRLRKPGDVSSVLVRWSEQVYRKSAIRSVVLFESVTKSTSSVYEERLRWALEGRSKRSDRHTSRVQRGSTASQNTQQTKQDDDHGNEPTSSQEDFDQA